MPVWKSLRKQFCVHSCDANWNIHRNFDLCDAVAAETKHLHLVQRFNIPSEGRTMAFRSDWISIYLAALPASGVFGLRVNSIGLYVIFKKSSKEMKESRQYITVSGMAFFHLIFLALGNDTRCVHMPRLPTHSYTAYARWISLWSTSYSSRPPSRDWNCKIRLTLKRRVRWNGVVSGSCAAFGIVFLHRQQLLLEHNSRFRLTKRWRGSQLSYLRAFRVVCILSIWLRRNS